MCLRMCVCVCVFFNLLSGLIHMREKGLARTELSENERVARWLQIRPGSVAYPKISATQTQRALIGRFIQKGHAALELCVCVLVLLSQWGP